MMKIKTNMRYIQLFIATALWALLTVSCDRDLPYPIDQVKKGVVIDIVRAPDSDGVLSAGITDGNYKVPDKETLQKLLPLADSSKIDFNEKDQTVSFEQDGMEIDFGGIAKGYTSGRIMDIFREHGITSGMVSLGGNVQVLGIKTDGSKWRVAVQNPEDTENYLGVLETQDRAVITSGGYERYFEQDGKTYQHILDPKTGYPADSGLTSVTIVSADGTLADGLSTSLFVMGKEKAVAYWRAHSEEFDAILVEKDGTVSVTENIADQFTPDDVRLEDYVTGPQIKNIQIAV